VKQATAQRQRRKGDNMKHFIDGNQLCITKDDFVDLQESPAVFYPLTSEIAQTVLADGVRGLPVGDLMFIYNKLKQEAQEMLLVKAVVSTQMSKVVADGAGAVAVDRQ